MPTVELDIIQLADEGGTAPIAPITVTDAVLDENGDTLTDTLDTLKNGLTVKSVNVTLSNGQTAVVRKTGNIATFVYTNNQDSSVTKIGGQLPVGYRGGTMDFKLRDSSFYSNSAGQLEISASAWAGIVLTFVIIQ